MKRLGPAALVALAAGAVYAHTLGYQFVYDDMWVIVKNERVHALASWREILVGPWWPQGLYRPLTSLTYAADWTLGGGSPVLFHVNNVLLHALASVLVYALAARLLGSPAALAAGLFFAVHPVHVEAVANLVGRAEILAALFGVAAVLLYLKHGDAAPERRAGRLVLALATVGLALLGFASKETALALPGLLLIADWAGARRRGEAFRSRLLRQSGLLAAVVTLAVLWVGWRYHVLGELAGDAPAPGLAQTGAANRLLIMLPVVAEYLRLLLFPLRLSADYSPDFLPATPQLSLRTALGAVLLAACLWGAVAARRRAPAVTTGLAWVGASLVIVSNVLVPSGILLAERTLYLASVGICLLAGWAWAAAYRRVPAAGALGLTAVLALAAARTATRAPVWRDNETLFNQIVQDAPGSYRADWVASGLAYTAGDSTRGELLMRRGLRIYGGNAGMWSHFAQVMERQRRWREAADYHWAAFTADHRFAADAARAVAAYVAAGAADTAQVRLEAAERLLPPSTELTVSASHVALARGDAAEATSLRASVARERRNDYRLWLLAATAALRARDCAVLAESVERIGVLNPGLAPLPALRDSLAGMGCGPTGGTGR